MGITIVSLLATDRKLNPVFDEFDPIFTGRYLTSRIQSFTHPTGLIAYWRTGIVRLRLSAMPKEWRLVLERRYTERLEAINENGPDFL